MAYNGDISNYRAKEAKGIGAISLALNDIPNWARQNGGYPILKAGTIEAQMRHVPAASISGSVITIAALDYAIAVDDKVIWKSSPICHVNNWAAKADSDGPTAGTAGTDSLVSLQRADTQARAVGGRVTGSCPSGYYYRCSSSIYLYDNSDWRNGGNFRIYNSNVSGVGKNIFIAGNIAGRNDGSNNPTGLYDETWYDIDTLAAGTRTVTFETAGESANFAAGNIVFLQSFTKWAGDTSFPVFVNTNVVRSVGAGTLELKYPVPDTYTSSGANDSKIAKYGTVVGIDGAAPYMAKNVNVDGLILSAYHAAASFWYAMYLACIESTFRNITVEHGAKGIGTGGASYNYVSNFKFDGQGTPFEFAYFSCFNVIHGVWATLSYAVDAACVLGLGLHEEGSDNLVDGFFVDGAGLCNNVITTANNHRSTFRNGVVMNADNYGGILGGWTEALGDCFDNVHFSNSDVDHVFISGTHSKLTNCHTATHDGSGYAVRCSAGANQTPYDYLISGCTLGDYGTRTAKDIIYDTNLFANGKQSDNFQHSSANSDRARYFQATIVTITGNATGDLYRQTLPTGAPSNGQGWHIVAGGIRAGVNDAKEVDLYLGTDLLLTITYIAAATGQWRLECDIVYDGAAGRYNSSAIGYIGATVEACTIMRELQDFDPAVDISIVGTAHNAGDTVSVYLVDVEPIG